MKEKQPSIDQKAADAAERITGPAQHPNWMGRAITVLSGCDHLGDQVIFPNKLCAYGAGIMGPGGKDLDYVFDVIVALNNISLRMWDWLKPGGVIIGYPMKDMGGVPRDHAKFIEKMARFMEKDKRGVLFCCMGGHGRTGTMLASLAAYWGVEEPVNYVRQHYCKKAVETRLQISAVYDILGKPSPKSVKPSKESSLASAYGGTTHQGRPKKIVSGTGLTYVLDTDTGKWVKAPVAEVNQRMESRVERLKEAVSKGP